MLKTNFKIGVRNVIRNRSFFVLNAVGLTIGLTAVLLIALWVYGELSFNKSLTNYDHIVSVMQNQKFNGKIGTYSSQPMQLAPVLRDEYGNQFKYAVTASRIQNFTVTHKNKIIKSRGRFAEPDLANILNLGMISGNKNALKDISSLLISKSASVDLFGEEDPMGKTIMISNKMEAKVAGVYKDLPKNSSFHSLKFIAPWELLKRTGQYEDNLSWGNFRFQVFAQLEENVDINVVSNQIKYVTKNKNPEDTLSTELFLFPMSKWYLHSQFENGKSVGGRIENVILFGVIGFFILLLACVNFMNLSTVNALKRSQEVGIRKTLGSSRRQLALQFFTESFIIIFFSFCLALLFTDLLLPEFNTIIDKEIKIPFQKLYFWIGVSSLLFVTALLSSSYPSFYLSAFKPVKVFKGLSSNNKNSVAIRSGLLVLQFTISGILIVGTLTVIEQINYAKNRPLGFNKDLVVSIPINNDRVLQSYPSIKNELLKSPYIDQVTASDVRITRTNRANGDFHWEGKDPKMKTSFRTVRATPDFGKMIGWNLLEGRDFSSKFPSDSLSFIVNESAVKYMGIENPVGKYVKWGYFGKFKIIGVVKDMVTLSPYDAIEPSIYTLIDKKFLKYKYVNIKIAATPNAISNTIRDTKTIFKKYNPEDVFSYNFLDEEHRLKFKDEERIAKLTSIFSIVALIICCFGVLGLTTYTAQQRKKEIGIRKVLGASVYIIWRLLSKQFIILAGISLIIAIPIGYYFSSQWLQSYSYRININFSIFMLSAFILLIITLLTVSFQAIRSATNNPVDSLRTE